MLFVLADRWMHDIFHFWYLSLPSTTSISVNRSNFTFTFKAFFHANSDVVKKWVGSSS